LWIDKSTLGQLLPPGRMSTTGGKNGDACRMLPQYAPFGSLQVKRVITRADQDHENVDFAQQVTWPGARWYCLDPSTPPKRFVRACAGRNAVQRSDGGEMSCAHDRCRASQSVGPTAQGKVVVPREAARGKAGPAGVVYFWGRMVSRDGPGILACCPSDRPAS
jgi:hypothetical protein